MNHSKRNLILVLIVCLGLAPMVLAAPRANGPTKALERAEVAFDRATFAHQMSGLHHDLISNQVNRAFTSPITVNVTPADLEGIRNEMAFERKMRVGIVKDVRVPVDFSDLRGHIAMESVRDFGAVRGNANEFVWSGPVLSPGAAAMRVHIMDFHMPEGSALYVYTPEGMAFGPYTGLGPNGTGEFWTNTIVGSDLILQVHHQGGADDRPSFVVAGVGHMTTEFELAKTLAPQPRAGQQNCTFNEDCVVGSGCQSSGAVSTAVDAVALMNFVSGPYVYICSGGLVADSDPGSSIPYFLTANHCISKGREASTLETFFFYTSNCGSCPAPGNPSTNGASIVSSNRTSDYTLLQLGQSAPQGASFLGWDSNAVANTNGTELFRLSHPKGAPQSYSEHVVDTSKPTCQSWPRGNWIYSADVLGATEGGSSGSPVVNAAGQIVGQLSGGCGFNVGDVCDSASNATVDGAFAAYFDQVSQYLGGGGGEPQPEAGNCADGIDNDGDGLIDCEDGECASDPSCDIPGGCTDADGDGWCVEEGDCDDSNPNINPGEKDRGGPKWSDGVDNDCDGVIDG